MVNVADLSPVGLGTYRMDIKSSDHRAALLYAIRQGCNLIDTASYYMYGGSELMIGDLLKASPELSDQVFIVTKAGYYEQHNRTAEDDLIDAQVGEDMVVINDYRKHCIHPAFLNRELQRSLQRMNRSYVDCFLLHNPEYYFDDISSSPQTEIYYERIKKGFEFCEQMVAKKVIRYYGVSSNTLALSKDEHTTTNLKKLIQIANEISPNHHFKFIQFPFNFFEQGALEKQYDGKSLIELAHENDIITMGNRPLSTNDEKGFVRFAAYPEVSMTEDEISEHRNMAAAIVHAIDEQVKQNDPDYNAVDFPIVQFLLENFDGIGNIEAVGVLYQNLKIDLLNPLFEDQIPAALTEQLNDLKEVSKRYSRIKMSERALEVRAKLIANEEISKDDNRRLPAIACEKYLDKGIDHVLVGARKNNYIDQVMSFYKKSLA